MTDKQRRLLCEMVYRAFLELRVLGHQDKGEQSARLASAFHNVPVGMFSPDFCLSQLRRRLEDYQQRYPREAGSVYDYLQMLEQVEAA